MCTNMGKRYAKAKGFSCYKAIWQFSCRSRRERGRNIVRVCDFMVLAVDNSEPLDLQPYFV